MFTVEQQQKIVEALNAKNINPCPSCGKEKTWSVGPALVLFVLQPNPSQGVTMTGQSLPCIPLICSNCGNTMFHNAVTLGLGEVLGLRTAPVKEAASNG